MKIAYVTSYDAKDIHSWSGTGYFIWKSLAQRGIEVELIGPLSVPFGIRVALAIKKNCYAKVLRKYYLPNHDVLLSKAYARLAWQQLQNLRGIEAVFSPGAIPVAFLPGKIPVVTYSDATHKLLFDSYPGYQHLSLTSRQHGDCIEQAAIDRASASVFSSEWARASAIRDYHADPDKVHVVPFGANFEEQLARDQVIGAIDARGVAEIRLLFIGVEWERKGGPVALEVVRTLVKAGLPARLTIIGCSPTIPPDDASYVDVRGFISKHAGGQQKILSELGRSHFLIVLSEADCSPLVYCEASALGVPSLARNVGGVGSIIKNDLNGRLFEANDTAKDMADWIVRTFQNPEIYRRLAFSAIAEYDARLNWMVAAEKLAGILESVINHAG